MGSLKSYRIKTQVEIDIAESKAQLREDYQDSKVQVDEEAIV